MALTQLMSTIILYWQLLLQCAFLYWFKLLDSRKTATKKKFQTFNNKTVRQVKCKGGT